MIYLKNIENLLKNKFEKLINKELILKEFNRNRVEMFENIKLIVDFINFQNKIN